MICPVCENEAIKFDCGDASTRSVVAGASGWLCCCPVMLRRKKQGTFKERISEMSGADFAEALSDLAKGGIIQHDIEKGKSKK